MGLSYRPEFDEFWKEVIGLVDCVEYIPDELPVNERLLSATSCAVPSHLPAMAHSTSLSVGSADLMEECDLADVRRCIDEIGADLCSDHLAFRRSGDLNFDNFCLPLGDRVSTEVVLENHRWYQEKLGRRLILENVTINGLVATDRPLEVELDMFRRVAEAEIGILLDVNNLFVNCANFGMQLPQYLKTFPLDAVIGLHIAGFEIVDEWYVDSHMAPIDRRVSELAEEILKSSNAEFVVLERDNSSATRAELLRELEVIRGFWDRSRS